MNTNYGLSKSYEILVEVGLQKLLDNAVMSQMLDLFALRRMILI